MINRMITMYRDEKKSIRQICRELEISERSKVSSFLRDNGCIINGGRTSNNPVAMVGMSVDTTCPECGNVRKRIVKKSGETIKLCGSCAVSKSHLDNPRVGRAEGHYNWKGGINLNSDGYVVCYVKKTHHLFPMSANSHRAGGYILQHRMVMAKHLERCLKPYEIVHHIDGDKQNNNLDNLKLTTREKHGIAYSSAFQDGYRQGFEEARQKYDMSRWGYIDVE